MSGVTKDRKRIIKFKQCMYVYTHTYMCVCVCNITLLSTDSAHSEGTGLDSFLDEFDNRHDNGQIKLH